MLVFGLSCLLLLCLGLLDVFQLHLPETALLNQCMTLNLGFLEPLCILLDLVLLG
jgi:hypothetical protein